MPRLIKVPSYPDVRLTPAGLELLQTLARFDPGARAENGLREHVYHPGPSSGTAAKALERQYLVRYARSSRSEWIVGIELTAAGVAVLAAVRDG